MGYGVWITKEPFYIDPGSTGYGLQKWDIMEYGYGMWDIGMECGMCVCPNPISTSCFHIPHPPSHTPYPREPYPISHMEHGCGYGIWAMDIGCGIWRKNIYQIWDMGYGYGIWETDAGYAHMNISYT